MRSVFIKVLEENVPRSSLFVIAQIFDALNAVKNDIQGGRKKAFDQETNECSYNLQSDPLVSGF